MENISPVIFFVIYLAITAWAKQRKAQAKKAAPTPVSPGKPGNPKPSSVQPPGIFEQIKRELMEMQTDELKIPPAQVIPVVQAAPVPPPATPKPSPVRVKEGSDALEKTHLESVEKQRAGIAKSALSGTWDELLDSCDTIERGIILKEVLGSPRSLQDQDTWVHRV